MKAWVKDGQVHFILPSEYDSEEMGKIYDVTWRDHESIEDLRYMVRQMQAVCKNAERRLAAKLVKEQGSDLPASE